MALDTGNDYYGTQLHQGLEYFLWKMSLPNTPSYNINTDLKYGVRLWFHNGIGNIMYNPFLSLSDTPYGDFRKNFEFKEHSHRGLELNTGDPDGEGIELGEYCFDLTPFVQSITLPRIGTTATTEVETLLGKMQVGTYSPYTSDGGQEISFTVIDTQYSILDAIFYPWLKMIGTPNWYDPAHAYEQHTTPYPICTVEISTPMRWSPDPENSQNEAKLIPYVYQYLGARPKSYDIPEINADQRSTLTRNLTMVCDLVIVDLHKDSLLNKARPEGDASAKPLNDSDLSRLQYTPPEQVFDVPSAPESSPLPDDDTIKEAEGEEEDAKDDKEKGEDDTATQGGGGEPGSDDAPGPLPPDAPSPPSDNTPSIPSEDLGGPAAVDTPPPPTPPTDGTDGWASPATNPDTNPDTDPTTDPDTNPNTNPNTNPDENQGGNEGGGNTPDTNSGDNTGTNPGGTDPGSNDNPGTDGGDNNGNNPGTNPGGNNSGSGDGNSGENPGTDPLVDPDKTNPLTDTTGASAPRRRSMVRGAKGTPSDRVCKAIKDANTEHHDILQDAKQCILDHGSDYKDSDILSRLKDDIPQQFDSLLVNPLIDSVEDPATVVNIQDKLDTATESDTEPLKHHYRFDLADAKAIGGIITEVQSPPTRAAIIGNYSRVRTMKDVVIQIQQRLPKLKTNATEAFFAVNALESIETAPNSSLSFYWDDAMELWPVGLYLTPLHNELIKILDIHDAVQLPADTYPYLFRTSWFKDSFSDTEAFAVLRDALKMQEQEKKERDLGAYTDVLKYRIDSVSLWEIVDDNLNHTGVYWCKAWIVGEANVGEPEVGRIVICKMDYRGTILTDPIPYDEETMMVFNRPPLPGQEPDKYMVCSKLNFPKATKRAIFSEDDQWEVKKGGQSETDFNPLTAITHSKEYSFTTEYEHIEGARSDDDEHDNLRPTEYVHIEEWPQKGDPEADMDDEGFYTLSTMDEYGVMTQTHYKVDKRTAFDAQSEIDKEQREVLPLRMGQCLRYYHTDDGKYARLMVKRHNCWSGHSSTGEPYPTIHTTNTCEMDMFDQYIPSAVDYVAQYRHHKRRWRTAKSELLKLRQLIARLSARLTQIGNEMQEDKEFIAQVVTREKIQDLLAACAEMEEISSAYNRLIDTDIKQEANLNELRMTGKTISGKYNATPDTNLPAKLALVDDLHLHNLSIARVEDELKSIRDKQAELERQYRDAADKKQQIINELGGDLDEIYNVIADCVCNSWLTQLLWKGHAQEVEYLRTREDRRVKMERLVVFFDERIKQIEAALDDDPGSVQLTDVILECDWKAWGDWAEEETPEVQRIREAANKVGYKLRATKLVPKLRKRWNQAAQKRERLEQQRAESTALIYDNNYAYPGYVPKEDSATQEPVSMPSARGSTKTVALDRIIREYQQLINGKPRPKATQDQPKIKPKDACREVLDVYRNLHDNFVDYSDSELENSLLLVLASNFLNSDDGKAFQDDVVACRRDIEMSKRILEGFKQMADKEAQMLTAAKQKCKGIQASIDKLDKANSELIRRSGTDLPRDEYHDFRLNALQKVELQQSLDAAEATTQDLMTHYEESTLKTLSSYADELEAARAKYDSLMEVLKDRIDFTDTVIALADALSKVK